MKDIEFLKQLADDLAADPYYSEAPDRLRQIAKRFENLLPLEQGYKVLKEHEPEREETNYDSLTDGSEDRSREAHDRYKDKSE